MINDDYTKELFSQIILPNWKKMSFKYIITFFHEISFNTIVYCISKYYK